MPTAAHLKRDLRFIHRMSHEFLDDLAISNRKLLEALEAFDEEQEESRRALNYWLRTALRCFFGLVDAQTFAMRESVRRAEKSGAVSLPKKKLAKLCERGYDSQLDQLTKEVVRVGFADRLKLAFKYFPKLFGADYRLEAGSEGYRGFRVLLQERNNFTHPRRIEDLFAIKALPAFWPSVLWYLNECLELISACSGAVGLDFELGEREWPRFSDSDVEKFPSPSEIFDEDFYESLLGNDAASVYYIQVLMQELGGDISRSLAVVRSNLDGKCDFASRNLARILFSVAEGTLGLIEFYLRNAPDKGELKLSEAEEAVLNEREFSPESLVKACQLYSDKVGFGRSPSKSVATWNQFRAAHRLRDQFTHPRTLKQLKVSDRDLDKLLGAASWYSNEILGNLGLSAGSGT